MIEQCDPSVASWSADGKSFVIRDVDSFAKVGLVCIYSTIYVDLDSDTVLPNMPISMIPHNLFCLYPSIIAL